MQQRAIFAFSFKPAIMLLIAAITLAIGGVIWIFSLVYALFNGLLLVRGGINWKLLFRPWKWAGEPADTFRGMSESSRITHREGRWPRPYWIMLSFFIPLVQVTIASASIVGAMALYKMGFRSEWFGGLGVAWGFTVIHLAGCSVYLAIAGLITLATMPAKMPSAKRNAEAGVRNTAYWAEQERRRNIAVEAAYGDIVCGDPVGRRARVPQFTLANPRPAAVHWFQELKANHCKVYAARD
jgi:hypothetical protein